jgi:hypothetical protein
MTNKTYHIKTIKELMEIVTEKNIDCFLIDFENWLRLSVKLKSIAKQTGSKMKMLDEFGWIDDGTNDAFITIKVREKNETK